MTNPSPLTALYYPDPPNPEARWRLVMLHGWGADGQDLWPLGSALGLQTYEMVFPDAPFPHPHFPQGRAWYNLESSSFEGLGIAREALHSYLLQLAGETPIPLERTVLGGFSQGGAMAVDVGLELPLAGVFALSGYLHFQPEPHLMRSVPPLLLVHGTADQVVPIAMARQMREGLQRVGIASDYQELPMGHEISGQALGILQRFLQRIQGEI